MTERFLLAVLVLTAFRDSTHDHQMAIDNFLNFGKFLKSLMMDEVPASSI